MGMNGGGSSTSLAPGFRFHPTDEELVSYYLKRKVSGKPFRFDAISEIDVYKSEPWDLPGLSKLKSRDLEWYFFSNLDKKYGNGSRTNRATIEGYWKTTGKDRPVQHRSKIVGMKKTLVYHRGRAPRGERSNWVMHEYKLVDELQNNVAPQEAFVLCRIFHKSGSGPKNGEQYGAPFVEEEWEAEDNEASILPGETAGGEVIVADGSIVKENSLNQPIERSTPLLNIYNGDSTNFAETLAENESSSLTGGEQEIGQEISDEHKMSNLPVPEPEAVNNNYVTPRMHIISQDVVNYLPGSGEQSLDKFNNGPSDEGFYLEANDLLEPIGENSPDFQLIDEYIGDVNNDIDQFLNFDPSDMLDIDDILNDLEYPTIQNLDRTIVQPSKSKEQLPVAYDVEGMSCSEEVMVAQKFQPDDIGQYLSFDSSDFFDAESSLFDQALVCDQNLDQAYKQPYAFDEQFTEAYSASSTSSSEKAMAAQNLSPDSTYSFMNQASEMLGNFPTSPALASELPTEDIVAKLQAAMQSSSSPPPHLKAQKKANRIRSSASHVKDNGVNWSLDKCGNVNLVFSFNLPDEIVSPSGVRATLTGLVSRRMTSRAWLYVLFFAVMVFCISNKVDNCIYAR